MRQYYNTLRYLKWQQIKYRLWYLLKDRLLTKTSFSRTRPLENSAASRSLKLVESIPSQPSFSAPDKFRFLNLEHRFENGIDWNFSPHGKLWTYNLNYFEFLEQPAFPVEEGLRLIHDFIEKEHQVKDGTEPFPTSLRIIFWIRFLARNEIKEEVIDQSLYRQLYRLKDRLEYHLMGNHLLENAFSILFGASYFSDESLFQLAEDLLRQELEEQVLEDGAHFELSPMYHQLMLYRLLDVINLLIHNPLSNSPDLLMLLRQKAALMMGWLREITFANGDLPRVNDSIPGIAPPPLSLFDYATRLGLEMKPATLGVSGYRKFNTARFELLIDAGQIGPDYIPGHAHSDTFNFILHHRYHPLIVDTGISTYEKNAQRNLERSTASHNTVMVAGREQSEVWGGFRVAKRARITSLQVSNDQLVATHDGYRSIGVYHQRSFSWKTDQINIFDQLTEDQVATAFLHFHPNVRIQLQGHGVTGDFGTILFTSPSIKLFIQDYSYALGFNRLVKAQKVVIHFKQELTTKIQLL